MRRAVLLVLLGSASLGCPKPQPQVDAGPPQPPPANPCDLPGAWVHDSSGFHVNSGGEAPPTMGNPTPPAVVPDYSWLTIPEGFCVHPYAVVSEVRQIRFAPGGELFVASPSDGVAGGARGGVGQILVVPDDNGDGLGDSILTFNSTAPATQGIMFANDSFYFQDSASFSMPTIRSEPYALHQRVDNGQSQVVASIDMYTSTTHWPKTMDIADDGTIYVGNGGDQGEQCEQPMPFHGGILSLDGASGVTQVAMGLRNPIEVKCHHDGNDHCFSLELGKDGSGASGGREKLIPIHPGDNWGFPCCASTNASFGSALCADGGTCAPDCSTITPESDSFLIGNTPFGFDFEDTAFPARWDHHVFVALHGAVGSWTGARIVAVEVDANTGLPLPGTTADGGAPTGAMADFATGWDDNTRTHGRPSDIAFSPDGRMFVANDTDGEIFWIAPIGPRTDGG